MPSTANIQQGRTQIPNAPHQHKCANPLRLANRGSSWINSNECELTAAAWCGEYDGLRLDGGKIPRMDPSKQ